MSKSIRQKDNLYLRKIEALTYGQGQMIDSYNSGLNIIASGCAGTGKTFIACYLALKSLFANEQRQIIFVRSTVQTRDLGFLPGSVEEKILPFFEIYKDHVNFLADSGTAWDSLTKKGSIKLEPTAFLRGATWNDAIIIVDESQNFTRHELYSVLSRLGKNSRILILGDSRQTDLNKGSSSEYLRHLSDRMYKYFDVVNFTYEDIVRSAFCKQLIIADADIL